MKPYREYSVLAFDRFEPIGACDVADETWREWELGDWTRMKYVAIVDSQLWEWSGFIEDFQSQKLPAFTLCQGFERHLLGDLSYQARFDWGVILFPNKKHE